MRYCIFTNNIVGISVSWAGPVYIEHCTFVDGPLTHYGLTAYPVDAHQVELWYTIMWDRDIGEYFRGGWNDYIFWRHGCCMSLNPQFCGVDDYFLQSDSPCAPGTEPLYFSFFIGALPVGCGSVKVEAKSWGEVKALYR